MKRLKIVLSGFAALMTAVVLGSPVWAATGVQVGASGKTYASAGIQCAMHPTEGMSPVVQAGLYNPKRSTAGIVSLNGTPVAMVTFYSPDTNVWLANALNTVVIKVGRNVADSYSFDAISNQANICIPDTSGNIVSGDLEYAASNKSYATVTPGCAFNPRTNRAQPYIHLFDNGTYLLNVSVNNVPLTQLSISRTHTPVFLSPGLNVISAANATLSTDYYVRDGGTGTCTLP